MVYQTQNKYAFFHRILAETLAATQLDATAGSSTAQRFGATLPQRYEQASLARLERKYQRNLLCETV